LKHKGLPLRMKSAPLLFFSAACFCLAACTSKEEPIALETIHWISGSEDCATNNEAAVQVVQYTANTWILRQNKCINYEAPFMYLFLGNEKALLVDTGATEDSTSFPLYKTVTQLIKQWEQEHHTTLALVVAHTHNHGDHRAADAQFAGKPNTTVVGLQQSAVSDFFGIAQWPTQSATYDLGNRALTIIPIPGHQESSIAIYDLHTQLLLTGDTFYPGRLYVRDWNAFKESITRLSKFCETHPVTMLLGNHIEMTTTPRLDYVMGTPYQPHEQPLQLTVAELNSLDSALHDLGTPVFTTFDKFILVPLPTPDITIASEAIATLYISGYPDFLATDGDDVWVTNADTIQKLSSQHARPIVTASAPGICGAPVVAFGSLWIASCSEKSVLRLDGATGKIIVRIATGVADLDGELSLAAGAGSIWILSDKKGMLSRIDPSSNQVIAEIPVKPNSFCAVFGFDAVWITNTGAGSVQRINTSTNIVEATIDVGPTPRFLAAGERGVWTLNQGDGTISRIDPQTNKLVATIEGKVPGTGGDIATGNGRVWVRAIRGRMLQSLNPMINEVEKVYGPLNGSGAVRVTNQQVWVTAHDVNKVWVIR
jgi:hydroxyacylglutathione hydrolase